MTNADERRWRQRLERFGLALVQLDEACKLDSYTNLERAGLVQTFVFSYELGWKVLKDLLFYEGHELNSPREVIRKSYQLGFISEGDCETFLGALGNRNRLTHMYDESSAQSAEALIKSRYHPMLRRLWQTLNQKCSE